MTKEKQESKDKVNSEKVSKETKQNKDKVKELTESLQRLQAEFENYKKRTDKQNQEFIKFANKELIIKLLPLLDNFELALKNTEKKEEFVKGVELIFAQLMQILEEQGLKKLEAKNKTFDPYLHEALMQDKDKKKQDNIILEEFQKGYLLNNQVIRHSKVKVNKR